MSSLVITIVPQLSDNYVYLLQCAKTGEAAIVDCPDADAMIAVCEAQNITPSFVLNTHHHWDHVGGNEALRKHWPDLKIMGFEHDKERITAITTPLKEGERFRIGEAEGEVLCTFGHTVGHISFYFAESEAVFCGDTMFSVGCGRIFEGTAEQMHESLQKIGALPASTNVYCGHEYTASNIRFALSIDGENKALQKRQKEVESLREQGKPTLPTTIAQEWETNPFLRVNAPAIREAALKAGADLSAPSSILGAIRKLKDNF